MALGDTLKNYVVGVGIKDNNFTAGLKNMSSKLSSFVSHMGIMLSAGSLGMAFKKFVDVGSDISNFSAMTGIAEQDITALGGALEQFGGNIDTAKSSLQALQQGLSQAEWGQGQLLETAAMYGVELYNQNGSLKTAEQLLIGLASDFQHLTKAQQYSLGSQLGLDESTIMLLQQGKASVKDLLKEQQRMGAMNAEQAMEAKKFQKEWLKLKHSLSGLGKSIAVDIMPHIIAFVKQLSKAVEFVRNLDTYTIVLAASFGVVGYAIKNLQSIMTIFSKSFLKANLPLLAIITGLTVLFLIVEDIVGYFNGKDSLFGKFLNNEKVQQFMEKIKSALTWVKDFIAGFSFDALFEKIKDIGNTIKNIFTGTFDYIKEVISTIGTNLGAFIVNPIIDVLNKLPFIDLELQKIKTKELPSYSNFLKNNQENNNTVNQNNTVNVTVASTGDSLQDITKAVEKGFNSNYLSPALLLNNAK